MLQILKNNVVTGVSRSQMEVRKLELDWYINNFVVMAGQAALIGGFAFAQISKAIPEGTPFPLEVSYLLLSTTAVGCELCVVLNTTLCCLWGPGLALRGPMGPSSVNQAVDKLRMEQGAVFALFLLGLMSFYVSNLLLLWCYFPWWIAAFASLFLSVFLLFIIVYTIWITATLR